MRRAAVVLLALGLAAAGCSGAGNDGPAGSATTTSAGTPTTATVTSAAGPGGTTAGVVERFDSVGTRFEVTEVATGLDTVWSLAWDPGGALWYTERGGRIARVGQPSAVVEGVAENGEGGLMGLAIDGQGRQYVMYTGLEDNRIVRLGPGGAQEVLVSGIEKADIHDGGRLLIGVDGALYASTGDAGRGPLAPDPGSLNGKVLRIDPATGQSRVFSRGHRNIQGLCLAGDGRLLATEHGPDRGDEINVVTDGSDGGWPATTGNGIRNYTPTIAPAGCAVYGADLIPGWRGSMLFATLKGSTLHRLSFAANGSVSADEELLQGRFGRLRDVSVGPDGAVYVATSNRDGRGDPKDGDDRILRIAPAPS